MGIKFEILNSGAGKQLKYKLAPSRNQVTFKNEQSGEYQFYFVTYKVSAPGVIATIGLTAPVRQSVSHTIPIYNPLSTSVTLNTQVCSRYCSAAWGPEMRMIR